ncbi:MAG: MBL fold metallo-hydrolase [Lachnospiraceae bacterium]|nr:MBL fold metallo-hydrolase [Lachnospiraceae bacterium]MBR6349936.1 MBL fold metallo-hydrolase [Lachnospiraceae bacterium]
MAEIIQYASGMSNGFFIKGSKGVVCVDTGDLEGKEVALKFFEDAGIKPEDVILIIVTHYHPDHVRNINVLKELTNAPVLIHETEADALNNGADPDKTTAARNEFGRKLQEMFASMDMPEQPIIKCPVDIAMKGEEMDLSEWGLDGVLLHTPGHSRGSICVLLNNGDVLVGDVFSSNGAEKVGMMPFFKDPDLPYEAAQESVQKLLDRGAKVFYSGHGGPFTREYVQEKLEEEKASM